jgi:5'-3' exonuclease
MTNSVIAIDYSCLQYILYYRGLKDWNENIHGFKPEVLSYWKQQQENIIDQIKTVVSGPVSIVGCVDSLGPNGYWRAQVYNVQQALRQTPLVYEKKDGTKGSPEYKGNRPEKSSYSPFLQLCKELMYTLDYPVLKYPGLEADDQAGLLTKLKPPGVKLYLVTLDKDWLLLCNDEVSWVNLHNKKYLEVSDGEKALRIFQSEYKNVYSLEDVPHAKSLKGERSDNLPKGFDPRLADLVQFSAPNSDQFFGVEPWDFEPAYQAVKDFYKSLNLVP